MKLGDVLTSSKIDIIAIMFTIRRLYKLTLTYRPSLQYDIFHEKGRQKKGRQKWKMT